MKMFVAAILSLVATSAFAGQETRSPFEKTLTLPAKLAKAQFAIDGARLVQAPTKVEVKKRDCGGDSDLSCDKKTVLESVSAVEVRISYLAPTRFQSEDAEWVEATLYVRPSKLSATAVEQLRSGRMNAKQARQHFQINKEMTARRARVLDQKRSEFCEDSIGGGSCKDKLVYKDTVINELKVTVSAR